MNENVDIFICTHTDFSEYPRNNVYKIVGGEELKNKYDIPVYIEKNGKYTHLQKYINEFTRMHWICHNVKLKDYVGFCHYGRFFNFYDNVPNIDEIFKTYDIIVNKPMYENMYNQYASHHNINDLDNVIKIIKNKYNDITDDDIKSFYKSLYTNNIYIMRRDDFYKYVDFVSSIIDEFIKENNFNTCENIKNHVVNNSGLYINKIFTDSKSIEYQCRIIAFLIERITTIYYKKYHKNIREFNFIYKNTKERTNVRKIYSI